MERKELTEIIEEVLARRSEALASVTSGQHYELKNRIVAVEKKVDELTDITKPVFEFISTAGNLRKALIWLSGLVFAATGSLLGLKTLIGWLIPPK